MDMEVKKHGTWMEWVTSSDDDKPRGVRIVETLECLVVHETSTGSD